jgi:hypothetical protein
LVANTWTVSAEEDPETKELIMPLPVDLLNQMGWHEGTELLWNIKEGHWTITEKKNGISEER